MAQLIKPNNALGDYLIVDEAIKFCQRNPGWKWILISTEEYRG